MIRRVRGGFQVAGKTWVLANAFGLKQSVCIPLSCQVAACSRIYSGFGEFVLLVSLNWLRVFAVF